MLKLHKLHIFLNSFVITSENDSHVFEFHVLRYQKLLS